MVNKINTSCTQIMFKIFVDWPDCDGDVVFSEIIGTMFQGTHNVISITPTADSVDNFLDALSDDEGLASKGIEVEETYGLMIGCCHVVFAVDSSRASEIPELIKYAIRRMNLVRSQRVRYYKVNETVGTDGNVAVSG